MIGKIIARPRALLNLRKRLSDRLAHFPHCGFGQQLPSSAQTLS